MSPPDLHSPSSMAGDHRTRRAGVRLGLLLLLGALFSASGAAEVKVGDPFPSLVEAGLDGSTPPTIEGKVVLVDFWASWCAPCKASFPAYVRLQSDYGSRGLLVVAVSVDEHAEAFDAFVKRFNPTFVTLRDKTQQLVRQVKVPGMPTCYLLGRDGRVRFIHQGFHGADTDRELRQEVDTLLAENSSPP